MSLFIEGEIQSKRLSGHDHYWRVIRKIGAEGSPFTIQDVAALSNGVEASVSDFVRRLTRAQPPIAEVAGVREVRNRFWREGTHREATTYRLLLSPTETPSLRRDGTPGIYGRRRQAMWNILRGPQARGGIDAAMLSAFASTEELPIARLTAREYLQQLEAAGYLDTDYKPIPNAARERKRYRLRPSMNSGPLYPRLMTGKGIYDPNRGAMVGPFTAEEES